MYRILVCSLAALVSLGAFAETRVFEPRQAELPDNHESIKFVVKPMNAWGKAGKPIESTPEAYWPKGALYPF